MMLKNDLDKFHLNHHNNKEIFTDKGACEQCDSNGAFARLIGVYFFLKYFAGSLFFPELIEWIRRQYDDDVIRKI